MSAGPAPGLIDPGRIAAWRDHLRNARERLFADYLARPAADALLRALTRLTDGVLAEIWAAHALPRRAALVAVGGYGRRELYPQSDVDVLILLDDSLNETERARFEPLIALLWDVGLPIGHSVRSLAECLAEAAGDITIQTNLLEARWITGSRSLTRGMCADLRARIDTGAFFSAKALEQKVRHGRHSDAALLLEPNLKESPGGLRDAQTLLWVTRAAGIGTSLTSLAAASLLTPAEARAAAADLRQMAHLRIRLHLLARRREDRLLFEFQEPIAAGMGVRARDSRRASERLMQCYYRAARHISLINELVMGELRSRLLPAEPGRVLPHATHFRVRGGLLDADDDLFLRHPELPLEAFLVLCREPGLQGCTPRLLRALWRVGRQIGPDFRRDAAQKRRFLDLLRQPRGVTLALRLMHNLGILGRYLPLFGRITGQMQHDQFHIYPVDEHILMVLRNLRRLMLADFAHEFPLAHRLIDEFRDSYLLLLAALFHDIAKGRGGDHSDLGARDARRFCRAHGLNQADTELVTWLVAEHLTLSQTAQKQDISDHAVITAFAARCGDTRHLTALYLLTIADIRGTSPKVWNAWKDKLTRELYLATRQVLEGGQPQTDCIESRKHQARAQLRLYGFAADAEAVLWQQLDDLYFLCQDARDIAWQTRRLLPVLESERLVVRARLAPVGEGVEVMVFAPDEHALFARICAFFARIGYSILAARIHTTRDGHALDTFYAVDPEHPSVSYRDFLNFIEHELTLELGHSVTQPPPQGGKPSRRLKAFPLEPKISLVASDGETSYVLSFTAGDRPGLLACVAEILRRHAASVVAARINTLGNRAEDVFVLTGNKLDQASARIALEQDLLATLRL